MAPSPAEAQCLTVAAAAFIVNTVMFAAQIYAGSFYDKTSTSQSPTDSCRTVRIPEDSPGFLRIPAGLHYNLDDFELGEKFSLKSSGILRTT